MKQRVEDSTRGKCYMNPKTYKGDVPVQTWLDSRYLATMSTWLDNKGISNRFLSDIVRNAMEIVVDSLIEQGEIAMVDDTRVARDMIEFKYRIKLNAHGRGERNIIHNITLTEKRKDMNYSSIRNYNEVNNADDRLIEINKKSMQILKEQEELANKERENNLNKQRQVAYAHPSCIKDEDIRQSGEISIDMNDSLSKMKANDEALKNF